MNFLTGVVMEGGRLVVCVECRLEVGVVDGVCMRQWREAMSTGEEVGQVSNVRTEVEGRVVWRGPRARDACSRRVRKPEGNLAG